MEERGKSRKRKPNFFSLRRLTSFLLAAAMIVTSVVTDLNTVYAAGSSTEVEFRMQGSDLAEAAEEAISSGNVVTPDDLNFTNGKVDEFYGYLFGEGRLYEVYPNVEGGDVDADVRVFIRLPETADDMYAVTGDEEVIFLYMNNGTDTLSFRSCIYYTEDGEEKVKKTDRVTVRSYASTFGDEEVNVIPDPAEPETQPEIPETETPAEETGSPEEGQETPAEEVPETDPVATGSELTASISRNRTALVAAPGEETAASEEETEAPAEEPAGPADDMEAPAEETAAPEEETAAPAEETAAPEEETEAPAKETAAPEEETEAPAEETAAPEEETEAPAEEPETSEEETAAPAEEPETPEEETAAPADQPATPSENPAAGSAETVPEKPEVTPAPKPDYGDLVGIGWSGTAKLYSSTLDKLHAMETEIVLTADVAGADGVTVTLSARHGVVPEGSYVEATAIGDDQLALMMDAANRKLNEDDLQAVDIFAADVYLYDADGNEIQPDGSVQVSFAGTGLDADSAEVFYMEEKSEASVMTLEAGAAYEANPVAGVASENGEIAFRTSHFTPYAVIQFERGTFYEVNFYYKDAENNDVVISEGQHVKEGEAAIAPAVPARDGYRFTGWDKPLDNIQGDTDFYAQYAPEAEAVTLQIEYVYAGGETAHQPWVAQVLTGTRYHNVIPSPEIPGYAPDQESVTIDTTVSGAMTWTVTYTGAETQYTVNHILLGGGVAQDKTEETEILTGITGDLTAAQANTYEGFTVVSVPVVTIQPTGTVVDIEYERNLYTLTFRTGENATYYPSEQYLYGQTVEDPGTPQKVGYTFAGWEQNGEPATIPGTMPASDLTFDAVWEANNRADYRVVYWLENFNGGYDYVDQKDGSGDVGAVIRDTGLTNREWENANIDPDGVERDASRDTEVTITADGTAVKNVYYSRKTFSIYFHMTKWNPGWLGFGGSWVDAGEDKSLRITAKYGASIIDQWSDSAHTEYKWYTEADGNTAYTMLAYMGSGNITVYGRKSASGGTITWYTQSLDGKSWDEYMKISSLANSTLTDEDKSPIEGFTWYSWQERGTHKWLKYTRNSYTISFENCTGVDDRSLKYEEALSSARPSDGLVQPPETVESDYTFGGWYTSPTCEAGTEVDWNGTMPSHNLQVYAKWVKPEYTVTFDPMGGTVSPASITEVKGTILEETSLPTPEKDGDEFLGWYADEACTRKFVPDTQIVKDFTLYAKWRSSESVPYTVKYVDNTTGEEIAEAVTREPVQIGTQVMEHARTDIEGYYPTMSSVTVQITKSGQEIIFRYVPMTEWTYMVRYLEEGTETALLPEHSAETSDREVVVSYKPVEGYTLIGDPTRTVTESSPEAVFYYKKNTTLYHVQYYFEQSDGSYRLDGYSTFSGQEIGATVTLDPADLPVFTGYRFNAEKSQLTGVTNAEQILTLQVYYSRDSYGYRVEYYYESEEGTYPEDPDTTETGSAAYGAVISDYEEKPKEGYTLDKTENLPLTISGDETSNVIRIYYALDENDDDIPDKYQLTVMFGAVNGTFEETGNTQTERVVTLRDQDGNPAEDGSYTFTEDQVPASAPVTGFTAPGTWDEDPTKTVLTGDSKKLTFIITYDRRSSAEASVEFYFDGVLDESVTSRSQETFGSVFTIAPEVSLDHKDHHYVLEKVENNGLIVGADPEANVVKVYYAIDEKGGEDPEDPGDGTPDKYQIIFTYISADKTTGTVTGTTREVITFRDEDGNYKDVEPTSPNTVDGHNISVQAAEGYAFDYWTVQGQNDRDYTSQMTVLGGETYTEDTVFTAYFAEDKIGEEDPDEPDGVPDKYQMFVMFGAVNGTFDETGTTQTERVVTLTDENGNPSEEGSYTFKEARIPASTPVTGFAAPGTWDEDPAGAVLTRDSEKLTFIISYDRRSSAEASVEFYFDGVLDESVTSRSQETFGSVFTIAPEVSLDHKDHHYVLEKVENNGLTVGADPEANVVKVYYALDENDDDTPDKYQLTVMFGAVNGTFEETGNTQTERVVTLRDQDGNPAEDGSYTFTEDQVPVSAPVTGFTAPGTWDEDPTKTVLTGDSEKLTFIITYDRRSSAEARVEFYFDGVLDESVTSRSQETFGSVFTIAPEVSLDHKDHHYVLEKVENNGLTVGADPEANVVKVYYAIDEKGGEDPEDPGDGTPDKYQITFTYVTEDTAKGTITGTVTEVRTLPKDENGNYIMDAKLSPKVGVTITAAGSYRFDYWTDTAGIRYETDDLLRAAAFGTDTTFTAHFYRVSSGGGGGGTSGGGGGTGPYNPGGGPGVVIMDEDVPLAALPEDSGSAFVIDDDRIPLAPLPKTGQQPLKVQMTMLLTGIFLVLASRKKREEEK